MSVVIVEGVPGAGKTYDTMVRFILPALRAEIEEVDELTKIPTGRKFRRKIYTNIEGLNYLKIAEIVGRPFEEVRAQIVEVRTVNEWRALLVHDREDSESKKIQHFMYSLVAMDEAQMVYPSDDFRDCPREFKYLLAWHRHVSMDFVFMTQSAPTMEKYITAISDRCYSIKNLGFITRFVGGKYVIHVREKPRQPNYATLYGQYNKKLFGMYKSNQGGEAFKLEMPNAIGGVMASLVLGSVIFLGIHFYSHGVLTTPAGIKKPNVSTTRAAVLPGGVPGPEAVEAGLKDSLADRQRVTAGPRVVPAAIAAAAGQDPKKTCYESPVRQTWYLKMEGETDEQAVRGWKDGSKIVCF